MGTVSSKYITYRGDPIGHGTTSKVFQATLKGANHRVFEVAAKKIELTDKTIEALAKEESKMLKSLDHNNIIQFYDIITEGKYLVILTEYASKGSLYNYLKGKDELPEKLRNKWIFQVASAIHYLKCKNVTHRDLKSDNCVITVDDDLKICDFGLATYLPVTTTAAMKGTVRYLPPEAMSELKLSPKADIFAFGIITLEILTCDEPYEEYEDMSLAQLIYQVCEKNLRPTIPDNCPTFFKNLIEKCWQADHKQRPESLEILRSLWQQFNVDLAVRTEEADGATWKPLEYEINQSGGLCFLADNNLAICTKNGVEVHLVTRETTQHLYTVKSPEWKHPPGKHPTYPYSLAVSESMPDSILAICVNQPVVYQLPCHEASQYEKKHPIKVHDHHAGDELRPRCITANANMAVVGLGDALVLFTLPEFSQHRVVKLHDVRPVDLSITKECLLVMGSHNMVVKRVVGHNVGHDLWKTKLADSERFDAASFKTDARQIYVTCYHDESTKGTLNKFSWDGKGTPSYVHQGCVIDDIAWVWEKWLAIRSDGILAMNKYGRTKVYSLEF